MSTKHEVSSGNIFADLGFEQPVEMLAKAELARRISSILKHRHMTQTEAAELLNIDQPKVSKIIRGQLKDFSLERLMMFLTKLDRDIEIVIKKRPRGRTQPAIKISSAA